jgi:NADH-quinone oxidoreductase subunit G
LARPSYFVMGDLLAAMGEGEGYWTAGAVFDAMAAAQPGFAGMSYDSLGLKGALLAGATTGATA